MKIMITGGAGFIGRSLAAKLIALGHDVVVLDILTTQIHGEMPAVDIPAGAIFVREDVRQLNRRPELLEGVEAVVHLAAETGTGQSMYQISHYVDANATGTAALLEGIGRCSTPPRHLILASSRAIYGEGAYVNPKEPARVLQPLPRPPKQLTAGDWAVRSGDVSLEPIATPETLPASPSSVYAATKMAQELIVKSACQGLNVRTTILRFQNVYGEGQSLQNPYTGIISIFFNRARQGLGINIFEDGEESRDFVHVDDVVDALHLALEVESPDGVVYNVGTGIRTSVTTLAKTLLEVANFAVPVEVTGQYRVGDIRHCFADIGAISRDFGFRPKVTLRAGLSRFVAWAASQAEYQDKSDEAADELRRRGLAKI
jgi:dTDP-L-rhamnose 4-epimerase